MQVRDSLRRISEVVKNRKALGFQLFQSDEEWSYMAMWDERMCPLCGSYARRGLFSGDELPKEFPDATQVGETSFRANVHVTHPEMKGECRCIFILLHPEDTMEGRLYLEKLEVV